MITVTLWKTHFDNNMIDTMTPDEQSIFLYAVTGYGFIIRGMGALTLSQFADEIEKVYDKNEPHNAAVCALLRKYSE